MSTSHGRDCARARAYCVWRTVRIPRHAIARCHSSLSGHVGGRVSSRALYRFVRYLNIQRARACIAIESARGCACAPWGQWAGHTSTPSCRTLYAFSSASRHCLDSVDALGGVGPQMVEGRRCKSAFATWKCRRRVWRGSRPAGRQGAALMLRGHLIAASLASIITYQLSGVLQMVMTVLADFLFRPPPGSISAILGTDAPRRNVSRTRTNKTP